MRSDLASMQGVHTKDATARELKLFAHRGFDSQASQFWDTVDAESRGTCGEAFRTGNRVIIPDVEQCDFMRDLEELMNFRHAGIRAAQATPLLSRTGSLVGMLSTHWRQLHQATERGRDSLVTAEHRPASARRQEPNQTQGLE
jgi:GAF domain-containing protein